MIDPKVVALRIAIAFVFGVIVGWSASGGTRTPG